MSAAVVAFHEFRDAYQQNLHVQRSSNIQQEMSLSLERRLNGGLNTANLNIPNTRCGTTTTAALNILSGGQSVKPTTKHPPLVSSNSLAVSTPSFLCNAINNSKSMSPTKEHRKLDRSISEPVDRLQQQPRPVQSNSSRYKTELCRPFEENGTCKYGDKCQFAHGVNELRTLARHPKYKTELCRTFHSTGFCPYGPRCHFIHNGGDSKKCLLNPMQGNVPSITSSLPQAMPAKKEMDIGGFSLGSAGEMSSSSSTSSSGSPTSIGAFFLEEALAAYSPVSHVPQTAPPVLANSFFFGQDYPALKSLSPIIPSVQQPFILDPSMASSMELLNSEIEKLNMDSSAAVTLPSGATVDVNRNIIRLPIFSRLSHGDSD